MEMPAQTKKILFLVTQSVWGGAQRYVCDLASHFASRGWDVTVAAGEDLEGELFARLHDTGVHTVHLSRLKRPLSPLDDLAAIAEIYQLCRKIRPQIVHLNSSKTGFLGALAARLASLTLGRSGFARAPKIIYTVHGLVLKEPLAPIIKLIYWLAEWFAGKLRDVTICVSDDDRRAVIRAHIAKPQNTVTIPVGVDRDIPFLSKEEARKALVNRHPPLYSPLFKGETNGEGPLPNKGSNHHEKQTALLRVSETGEPMGAAPASPGEDQCEGVWIGAIAGLYATKGLETLLAAAQRLIQIRVNGRSPLQFIIIGEGPERKKLERSITANHLQKNCHLLGHIPDAALYLKAFDCFVLPSLKEGLPFTILEALAAQVPIVATRVGGIPEIMEESQTRHLIQPNNPAALTLAILSALSATSTIRESPPKPIPTLQAMIEATERVYLN